MPRKKKPVPSYLHHKPTNQAYIRVTTSSGKREVVYLGSYGSQESKDAYDRIRDELSVSKSAPLAKKKRDRFGLRVNELMLAFDDHAEQYYRDHEGKSTSQLKEYRRTIKVIRENYGDVHALKFGPLALKAVQEKMVAAGLARSEVNRRIMLAGRIFKWAAAEELIPFEVYQRLTTVSGLQKGRTRARETEPIRPVNLAHVRAILPFVNRQVSGILEFMMFTGCRPGEACRLRRCDIDQSEKVWVYRPSYHKNTHRGKGRVIAVGPRAQELLSRFPTAEPTDYVFSPRLAVEEMLAQRSSSRKTPRYPSHMARNATKRKKATPQKFRARYTTEAVDLAVRRAIERLNRTMVEAGVEIELHIPKFSPNQIRHTHGTRVRKEYGLEAAQSVLGHEKSDVTERYAQKSLELAAAVAAELG
jgi:integrase